MAFQNSIKGNINRREITFGDSTKTVYGPVPDWNATLKSDDLASLGPQGMVLEARQLTVREMPSRTKEKRGWFELEALGNVVGEGSSFTARGERLTYSEEKAQIVLRGDGLSPAEIFQEDASGGPRRESSANELTYWLGMQRALATGIKGFELGVPGPPRSPKKKSREEDEEIVARPASRPGDCNRRRYLADSIFSTASRPVMPGVTPSPSAALLTSRILALNKSSGSRSGFCGVPRAMATARLNSFAERMS